MKIFPSKKFWFLALLVLAAIAAVWWRINQKNPKKNEKEKAVVVERRGLQKMVTLSGRIDAREKVPLFDRGW